MVPARLSGSKNLPPGYPCSPVKLAKFSAVRDHGVAHSTDCESGLKKSTQRLDSTHPMSSSCVPSSEPKEKGAMAPGSAPASNHGMPLQACPTKMPSTAAIAHRPWISSASRYHLRNAGSLPSPSGSKPKSPGRLREQSTASWSILSVSGGDPRLLGGGGGDDERAARRRLHHRDVGGIGERAPGAEERGLEHGGGRGGGGGRESHGLG
ncbi:hypothetical protein U9M48_032782 [Paspalum notatum var. saurae]|uniref:Uncharacterized protein n=1 Tax=Paspalum notatum var. saurae TaxID=547442 RepID=A0AAQ3U9C3_PASNO